MARDIQTRFVLNYPYCSRFYEKKQLLEVELEFVFTIIKPLIELAIEFTI